MTWSRRFRIACAALCLLGVSNARAALFDRGGGLIYDSDLSITWLANANFAQTSGYDPDGRMTWADANMWAAGLTFGGYSDWRLPTSLNQDLSGPCNGFSCSGSEMGHLFYVDGSLNASSTILNANFTNIQSYAYWSGTVYAPDPISNAWGFDFSPNYGVQFSGGQSGESYAWAVRAGDVAAPIPEPETYALMLAGLGLLGIAARRRKIQAAAAA